MFRRRKNARIIEKKHSTEDRTIKKISFNLFSFFSVNCFSNFMPLQTGKKKINQNLQ